MLAGLVAGGGGAAAAGGLGGATWSGRCSLAGAGLGGALRTGSLRIVDATSGLGATSATSSRICRLLLCVARSKSASRLVSVRTGASLAIPAK